MRARALRREALWFLASHAAAARKPRPRSGGTPRVPAQQAGVGLGAAGAPSGVSPLGSGTRRAWTWADMRLWDLDQPLPWPPGVPPPAPRAGLRARPQRDWGSVVLVPLYLHKCMRLVKNSNHAEIPGKETLPPHSHPWSPGRTPRGPLCRPPTGPSQPCPNRAHGWPQGSVPGPTSFCHRLPR